MNPGPRDERDDPAARDERPEQHMDDGEERPEEIAPDERIADGPAGAAEARTPGMGD